MTTFAIDGARFLRDGREHRVLSGALHYFRLHRAQWPRQLRMLRAMGLNAVETYVPWNLHERDEGRFERLDDLAEFLDLAAAEGLDAIVRPGPYICAEWENGGLPAWITHRQAGRIRCLDDGWLAAVESWFDVLIPVVAERQVTRGGNVIMVQVENEYGSFGSDVAYLERLRDGLASRGIDVPLFTSDGPEPWMLSGGLVDGVLATLNFGSGARAAFEALDELRPGEPRMVMEFWDGWFDHWGDGHVTRDPADAAAALEELLEAGASVNLYMAQGGTNFGTWSGGNRAGAQHDGVPQPTITSYDYDAPIDERGEPTAKFELFREVLQRLGGTAAGAAAGATSQRSGPVPVPSPMPTLSEAAVELAPGPLLFATSLVPVDAVRTPLAPTLDELGIDQGVAWHTTVLRGRRPPMPLSCLGVGDRVSVYAAGRLLARASGPDVVVDLPAVPADGLRIDLVVESLGRVNYGPLVGERKGITGQVRHGIQLVHGFSTRACRIDALPPEWHDSDVSTLPGPRFRVGAFEADAAADAWLAIDGVARAVAWVNGFCLGRLIGTGPQRALYVPWPVVVAGRNEVVVLDLEPGDGDGAAARVVAAPVWEG
ncbi:beta-galactosidase family protein [Agromyces sp. PvR057]|uniref:glycoside hydrolase family 35 protein n=1 Tax=Agromyces sp. PvR057 TaxID=3156403 RepID=UPI003399061F